MPKSIASLLSKARRQLAAAPFNPPTREAYLLLGHILGLDEAQLIAHPERSVDREAAQQFSDLLDRRLRGEPVAYLLGYREFYGRRFCVDHRVLIPRPETEHLVEAALELADGRPLHILDVGTGSGCIAVTLALEMEAVKVVGVDISLGALAVARRNARRHGATDRLALMQGDLTKAVRLAAFDIVISNPPYLATDEATGLSPEVRDFEPGGALFTEGAADSVHRRLISAAANTRNGTYLLLEIGFGQESSIRSALAGSAVELIEVRRDYAGIPRVVVARRI